MSRRKLLPRRYCDSVFTMINPQKWAALSLLLIFISGCSLGNSDKTSNEDLSAKEKSLINKACLNLPNLYERQNDDRPAIEVGRISRETFGELARLNANYLEVAEAFYRVDNYLNPVKDVPEDVDKVNAFCAGIGSLT